MNALPIKINWLYLYIVKNKLIMEKHFATYKQALVLKELGFDEPCFGWYHPNGNIIYAITKDKDSIVNAPLKSQVFEWFRKEHAISGEVTTYYGGNKVGYGWSTAAQNGPIYYSVLDIFSYEEAESACIDKLIELSKSGL